MKFICIFILFFLLITGCISETDYFKDANKYYDNKEYVECNRILSSAIKEYPNDEDFYWLRAKSFIAIDSFNKAISDCNYGIDILIKNEVKNKKPNYKVNNDEYRHTLIKSDLYSLRGIAKKSLNNYMGAIIDFDMAISLNSQSDIYIYRGDCKCELFDYNGAIADYKKTYDISALVKIGKIYFKLKNYSEAQTYLWSAIDRSSRDSVVISEANLYYGLAKIFKPYTVAFYKDNTIQDSTEGCAYLQQAKKLGSKEAEGYIAQYCNAEKFYNKGVDDYTANNYVLAISEFHKASRIDVLHSESANYYSGLCKFQMNDFTEAMKDLNSAIEFNAKNPALYNLRAKCKSNLSDARGAIADYDKVIELIPNDNEAYYFRGMVKLYLGDKEGGCMDLSKSGELGNKLAYLMIEKYCSR